MSATEEIGRALSIAADELFMAAAPDEPSLAEDCPELHGEMRRQAAAAIVAFLRALPPTVRSMPIEGLAEATQAAVMDASA